MVNSNAGDFNDVRAIAAKLGENIEGVLDALGLVEIRKGSPNKERREFALPWDQWGYASIYLQGARKGAWMHWQSGDKGDLFDLVAMIEGGGQKDRSAALKWAKRFLGLDREFTPQERKALNDKWVHEAKLRELAHEKDLKEHNKRMNDFRRRAKAMFLKSAIVSKEDRVWKYLSARGIDLDALGGVPGSLRLYVDHEYRDDNGGRINFDCMMAMMMFEDGKFAALHRTWLDKENMDKKAPIFVEKRDGTKKQAARKIWPEFEGAFIPLWKGKSGKSRTKVKPKSDTIIICEGIEDGLTHAMWRPDARIDVCGSLGNLGNYRVPPCCGELIIAADRDWSDGQAAKQLEKIRANFARYAKPNAFGERQFVAKIMYPPQGFKDFNDALMGKK